MFGRQAAGVGDVNADGHADFIVGAPSNDAGGENAGRAYVYSGKDGALLLTLTGERGRHVRELGRRRHGRHDVQAARRRAASRRERTGRSYVYNSLSTAPQVVIDAEDTGGAMGAMFLAVAGDIDGDGPIDLVITSAWSAVNGFHSGRLFIVSSGIPRQSAAKR